MITQTEIFLAPNHPEVQRDLADCHGMHRRVMRMFRHVNNTRDANEVLYRLLAHTTSLSVLIQAQQYPDITSLPHGYALPPVHTFDLTDTFDCHVVGETIRFELVANPTKKSLMSATRVDLTDAGAIIGWLERRLADAGCQLMLAELSMQSLPTIHGRHPAGALTYQAYHFRGSARVTDVALLNLARIRGVGPAKAYGCGLLTTQASDRLSRTP
ncbi:MAG: hypothetical protein RLZZ297_1470 [Chloroflexota bacterium]|jgi:CRISPR system Cascade subunit CasE